MRQPNGQAHHHRGRPPRRRPALARPPGRGAARVRSLSGSVVVIVVVILVIRGRESVAGVVTGGRPGGWAGPGVVLLGAGPTGSRGAKAVALPVPPPCRAVTVVTGLRRAAARVDGRLLRGARLCLGSVCGISW